MARAGSSEDVDGTSRGQEQGEKAIVYESESDLVYNGR